MHFFPDEIVGILDAHKLEVFHMRRALAAAYMLLAFSLSAGTISSISPSAVQVGSGEWFMTVNGTGLGDVVVFDGSAGHFEVDINSVDIYGNVTAWVPVEVINRSGTYTVYVKDSNGGSNVVNFTVNRPIRDIFRLMLPELLVASAKTREGASIKYDVSAFGAIGTAKIDCFPVSGSTFPLGNTTIKCSGTDDEGNRDDGEIAVTVSDTTPPAISLPKSFEVRSESNEGTYVKWDASAFDEIDGALGVSCNPKNESFFRPGRTIVTCEANDNSLNPTVGAFEVFVTPPDYGKLQIEVPADMKVPSQGKEGAVVFFDVRAYGSSDPDPVVTCSPASGDQFPMGDTKVYCIAEDDFGQRAENAFYVTVTDDLGLKMPDVNAEATSASGTVVTWDPQTDVVCSPESGTLFALGDTTVTCESAKKRGTFKVTVADTIAPHIDALRAAIGSANDDRRVPIDVAVEAVDIVDTAPRCSVNALDTTFDWRITSDLRVEVSANATPFRIQVTCVDAAGNRATDTLRVTLPGTARGPVKTN